MTAAAVPFERAPRPAGRNESMDCVVRALANATGMDYEDAHLRAKLRGRKDGRRTDWEVVRALFDAVGIFHSTGALRRPTVKTFLAERITGTYIAHVRGHVFAVRSGVALDLNPPKARQIIQFYWYVPTFGSEA